MVLLEHKDISPLDPNSRAFSYFFGGDMKRHGYFQIKAERKYFVSDIDPLSKNWRRDIPIKSVDAVITRRLMVEALDFIEDLILAGAFINKPLS